MEITSNLIVEHVDICFHRCWHTIFQRTLILIMIKCILVICFEDVECCFSLNIVKLSYINLSYKLTMKNVIV